MKKQGFTLIELLIVVSIIGILITVILTGLDSAKDKTKRASSLAEMNSLRNIFLIMELDTDVMVGGFPTSTCSGTNEYSLNPASPDCGGGLICNTSRVYLAGSTYTYSSGWDGPYLNEKTLTDPWGNYYFFSYNIPCGGGINQIPLGKCSGNVGNVVGIVTGGPDGDVSTYEDDEVVVVCP